MRGFAHIISYYALRGASAVELFCKSRQKGLRVPSSYIDFHITSSMGPIFFTISLRIFKCYSSVICSQYSSVCCRVVTSLEAANVSLACDFLMDTDVFADQVTSFQSQLCKTQFNY